LKGGITIFCPDCGEENEDKANYCFNCGKDLSKYSMDKDSSESEKEEINSLEKEELVLPIFLEKIEGQKVGDESFPNYYKNRYGVDPEELLNRALKKGYLVESDLKYNMYETTNADLKDVLREYDLKVSGVKDELVKRLLNNINEEELKSIFDQSYYQLSASGKELIENNEHIIYFHKSPTGGMTLKDYHKKIKENDDLNKCEAMIESQKKHLEEHKKEGDWGLYRNTFLTMADIYADSGESKKALELYLKVCNVDLSGLSNSNSYHPGTIILAPGIIRRIKKAMDDLNYETEDLRKIYFEVANELDLPKKRYSNKKSFNYIVKAIDKGVDPINEKISEENKDSSIEMLDHNIDDWFDGEKKEDEKIKNEQDIKQEKKENNVEYDKDGFVKPRYDKSSKDKTRKRYKYYIIKAIFILLNIFIPPLGVIAVVLSKKFTKSGKFIGAFWAVTVTTSVIIGETPPLLLYIFSTFLIATIIASLIGLIRPGIVGRKNRKQVFEKFGGIILISFILTLFLIIVIPPDVTEEIEEAKEYQEAGEYAIAVESYQTALEHWDEEQEYPFSREEVEEELETINEEHMVKVNFEVGQGEGEITPSSGTYEFYKNENIEIEAEAGEEWEFEVWKIEGEEVSSAEAVVEELNKDKTVKANFSRVEEEVVAEEEEEKAEELPPSEKDIDNYVDYLVEDTMGHSTNMGYTRLIDFWTEEHNNEKLVLRLQGDENFTSNMTRDGMIDNTEQVITQLYSERNDINDLEVQWYMVLIDERGNEENTKVINIEFDRANYNNVNWDNFLTSNLPDIADYYWAHPNYR